jgi:hypothetical protein
VICPKSDSEAGPELELKHRVPDSGSRAPNNSGSTVCKDWGPGTVVGHKDLILGFNFATSHVESPKPEQ